MNKFKYVIVLCFILIYSAGNGQVKMVNPVFDSQTLIVKLSPESSNYFNINKPLEGVVSVSEMFPYHTPAIGEKTHVNLSLIFKVIVAPSQLLSVLETYKNEPYFEYVERKEIQKLTIVPNDPEINKQSYFSQINANAAWDISQGSTNVKIGIVDSGTDMDHPDLGSEMYENLNDPVNGVDDDNDGYIDNNFGWDFYDDDNNPQIGDNSHGIHVAGIAAAATDNNLGIASIGFNTQFVPIRAGNGNSITHGYEGIVYAADMGCDIVNCSWGSANYSAFAQDVVNYATLDKNTLVVAATGNNGGYIEFFPAAYENVLSVGSIDSDDSKSSFTNYGYYVDVLAPGRSIYSAVDNGLYNYNTGTSMATPVVSGAVALLKAVHPQLSALQLAERIKTTCENIDGQNPSYENKIGYGKLNVAAALGYSISSPSIVFSSKKVTNKTDDVFKAGDSLLVSGRFTNYLAPAQNVVVSIQSSSNHVVANRNTFTIGLMGTAVQTDNYDTPFSFYIDSLTPINTSVTFEVLINDGQKVTKTFFEVLVNVDYLNIAINNMYTSLGSVGQFGYNDRENKQGLGMNFKSQGSQLFEGGLMIGTNDGNFTRVMDRVRREGDEYDDDFEIVDYLNEILPAQKGDYQIAGVFNDSNAGVNIIGLEIRQTGYASRDEGHENYAVLEYEIKNTSGQDLENISVGLFADFDVDDYSKNQAFSNLSKYYTYTKETGAGSFLYGVQLLSSGNFISYCMDNIDGGAGGVDISSGYNNFDKFITLSSNRYNAGFNGGTGNDVIQVTSSGGIDINDGDSVIVAFALIAAETKTLLDKVADSAYYRYNGSFPNSIQNLTFNENEFVLFPNPALHRLTVANNHYKDGEFWDVRILDALGREVLVAYEIHKAFHLVDVTQLNKGVYVVEIQLNSSTQTRKFIKK